MNTIGTRFSQLLLTGLCVTLSITTSACAGSEAATSDISIPATRGSAPADQESARQLGELAKGGGDAFRPHGQ